MNPLAHPRLRGALIYGGGDALAAWILGAFSPARCLGMTAVGALLYAWEIPAWFAWIDRRTAGRAGAAWRRTGLALLYFNPLWIARHLLFILVFSGRAADIRWDVLGAGLQSFLVNAPVSLTANFLIQNRAPLRWRFTASALFSAAMAVFYACSEVWFR